MVAYKLSSSNTSAEYYKNRKAFYSQFSNASCDSTKTVLEHGLYGSLLLERKEVEEIQYASAELWRILNFVKEVLIGFEEEELIRMGFPKDIVPFISIDYLRNSTVLSQFDFIINEQGIKAIGLNNVTPSLIKEAFKLNNEMVGNDNNNSKKTIFQKKKIEKTKFQNSKIENLKIEILKNKIFDFIKRENLKSENQKGEFLKSPNQGAIKELQNSLSDGLEDCSRYLGIENPKVVMVGKSFEDEREEYSQFRFIYDNLPSHFGNIEFLNIKTLKIIEGKGVFTPQDKKIDILIAPAGGYEDGSLDLSVFKLVKDKKLALLNPPSTHILQNKFTLYVLWNMYINRMLSDADSVIVEKYLAPTYSTPFGLGNCIRKPVTSQGENEYISAGDRKRENFINQNGGMSIYQEYIQPSSIEIIVDGEVKQKNFKVRSFMCNNKAVALACCVEGKGFDKGSHWLAVSHL